jgi:hypothetical protein
MVNAKRRKDIQGIEQKLGEIKEQLESLRDEEQEYYDNMPEAFQYGEKGEKAEAAIEALDDAMNSLEEIDGYLETAKE